MKRNFKLFVAAAAFVVMVLTLASCDVIGGLINPTPDTDSHEHTFSAEWSNDETNHWHAATCTDGEDCAEQKSDVAPHTYADGACSVCGKADPNYTPECTEHQYSVETVKEANCTEDGEKKFTCTVCGHSYTQAVTALGHDEQKIAGKEPTCNETGLTDGKQCTVCGEITKAQNEIGATGHSYDAGYCTACGAEDPNYNGPKTYVLDVQSFAGEGFAAGSKADGATEVIANYFTIHYSAKTKIDTTKNKEWEDGYTVAEGYRLNFGGTTEVNSTEKDEEGNVTGTLTKNAIEFDINGTATVKVWWNCGGDGREIGIYDENGDLVVASETDDVFTENEGNGPGKNKNYLSTLELSKPGKYFIGTDNTNAVKNGGNIIFKVEVVDTPIVEAPASELKVTTTDTYGWFDEYTFTATESGKYTFTVPADLGWCSKEAYDSWGSPEIDYMHYNYVSEPHTVELYLAANESYTFYVGAYTKSDWVIPYTFEACEVDDDPVVSVVTNPLVIGSNSINAADIAYEFTAPSAANLTLTAGAAIMGPVSFSYSINDGEAATLELGSSVTLALNEGDKVVIIVTASGYSSLTAAWGGETEDDDDNVDPSESDLVLGDNSVVIGEGDLENGVDLSFVATVDGTYTFSSNDLLAIVFDSFGMQIGRGQAILSAGTYTIKVVPFSGAGTFALNITVVTEDNTEPDGSEENPYVWETLPESATADGDSINKTFYTFTASASGTLTVTYPTANTWWALTDKTDGSLNVSGYSTENAVATMTLVAGHEYVLSLGSWNAEESDPTVTISFTEGATGDDTENTECQHDWWTVWYHEDKVEATCISGGVEVYQCDLCGEYKTEATEADTVNGHDYVTNMSTYKAATCQEDGYREATCSYCNDHQEYVLDHELYGYCDMVTEESTFKEPTCQTDGYKKTTCSVCGKVEVYEEEASDWYHVNEYSANYSVITCSVCGKTSFDFYVGATDTSYGIQIGTNYMGVAYISICNADYSVNDAFGYTATLADGAYTLTLNNMYENNDAAGLLTSTITVEVGCTGLTVTITSADGVAATYKNYTAEHVDNDADGLCDGNCGTSVAA